MNEYKKEKQITEQMQRLVIADYFNRLSIR